MKRLYNPYPPLHRKLVGFAANVRLESDAVARNEYVRLENMILWGMYYKKFKKIKFTTAEKEYLATPAAAMRGRTMFRATFMSPAQIVKYSHSASGRKYVSLFPRKKCEVRLSAEYQWDILYNIVAENPTWNKRQIFEEMRKYFEKIPAFRVYDMLYGMGFWDGQKNVPGLQWSQFLARFEKVTWAGDFFSVEVWTPNGQITYFVLFFIHLATQRVIIGGITPNATSEWLIQRIKSWTDYGSPFGEDARFLIRDRDRRYTDEVDWYFTQIGILPKKVSPGAPVMNCYAEQFVKKIKHECLGHCIFLSESALRNTINLYLEYYHQQRPNSKYNGGCIMENATHWQRDGEIVHVSTLPGLLGYYYRRNALNTPDGAAADSALKGG